MYRTARTAEYEENTRLTTFFPRLPHQLLKLLLKIVEGGGL